MADDQTAPPKINPPPAPPLGELSQGGNPTVAPPTTPSGPTMSAAPAPSLVERVRNVIEAGIPALNSDFEAASHTDTGTLASGETPTMQLVTPEKLITPADIKAHPVAAPMAAEILKTAGGLTSPGNAFMMVGSGGLGELPGAAKELIPKLISSVFSAQSLYGAYQQVPAFRKAIDDGDEAKAISIFTSMVLNSAMGAQAGQHAVGGVKAGVKNAAVPDEASTLHAPKSTAVAEAKGEAPPAAESPIADHITFNRLGGKEVRSPQDMRGPTSFGRTNGRFSQAVNAAFDAARKNEQQPTIDYESLGDQGGIVRLNSGGQEVGRVRYTMTSPDTAAITATYIDPKFRGQGFGQQLYLRAADEAHTHNRASSITSDLQGTDSFESGQVWNSLARKGHPIEQIESKIGSPGYKLDLTKPAEQPEAPPAQFEKTLARRGQLPNQDVNLAPAYGATGGYVGGLVDNRNEGSTPEEKNQDFINRLGPYQGSGLMDIPQHLIGDNSTTHGTISHELAHAVVGALMGMPPESGIKSHMHPDLLGSGSAAAIGLDFSKMPGAIQSADGNVGFNREGLKNVWSPFVSTLMAGGVAEDLGHNVPLNQNPGMMGDYREIQKIGNTMGFSPEQIEDMRTAGEKQAREILSRPGTMDLIKKAASEREPNLSKAYHMSAEKVRDVVRQIKEAQNGVTQTGGAANREVVPETPTGGAGTGAEGNVREGDGKTVSPKLESNKIAVSPNPELQASAQKYAAAKGLPEINHASVEQAPARANAIADAYEAAKDEPNNPKVQAAYSALKTETKDQFHHLRDDLGLKFEPTTTDPYSSPAEMMNDIKKNNRLKVFTGSSTGTGHPLSEIDPETGQSYNTLFRWVHDAMGHAAGGNDFSENGEKSATEAHAQMYSDKARPAMRAETEGQTSWFFHHPEVQAGRAEPGKFAEQKATLLPDEFNKPTKNSDEDTKAASAEDTIKNLKAKYGSSEDPSNMINSGASFLHADGTITGLGPTEHPQAIAKAGYMGPKGAAGDVDRPQFINETGTIRVRHRAMGVAGPEIVFSVPEKGVTPEQVDMMKQAVGKMGRNGNLLIEAAHGGNEVSESTHSWPENEVKAFARPSDVDAMLKHIGVSPDAKSVISPKFESNKNSETNWHNVAGAAAAKNEAGGIDPHTGESDKTGKGVEIMPELRQPLDHVPTADDFKNFYEQHKEIFDQNPELRVGWDNNSAVPGGHEINVGAVGPDAAKVGKKLDQKSAFDIAKGEIIPTGGAGLRTEFPNYPLSERIKDLKGEPQSNIKDFEHLSPDFYDHLEPDEREYLKGNKTLQKNAMSQYHKIVPSVDETTNAMQAGAALGGWWKRYIDIFHTLAGEEEKTPGRKKPEGLQLYHGTNKVFNDFDPMLNGESGDFGTHLGTLPQATGRLSLSPRLSGENIRPVYANIKNPIRVMDHGGSWPVDVANQLVSQHIISSSEYQKLEGDEGGIDPIKLRNLIEKKGYDGLVYLNRIEGVNSPAHVPRFVSDATFRKMRPEATDSYVALRPEQIQPKYSAELLANTIGPSHAEVLKQWHAAVSGNKTVQDANNLAWHSYADWLDAGKPTDRKSIDDIVRKNGAQPEESGKRGNAAMSDTRSAKGKLINPGLDTTKLFSLVNSPEMKGERPFGGDAFSDSTTKNPLMGSTQGARKIPSMGATVAGEGNLNRLVIDAHIRDFYGHSQSGGPAAQYIADSAHLRKAAEALGLKGGEGQEQLWGTVLGLKTLLKQGLTPEEAGSKLDSDTINRIGKDYAEVIANDPEITRPGGILDRLKEKYGIGRGAAGISGANSQASGPGAGESGPAGSETSANPAQLGKTAERIRGQISDSKIKKPSTAPAGDDTDFNFGANVEPEKSKIRSKYRGAISGPDFLKALDRLKLNGPAAK